MSAECARKVFPEYSEKGKYSPRLHASMGGEILAKMAFWQKIREEYRQSRYHGARWKDQPAGLPLERKAERGSIWVVNVILLE
jgi:hypothetical protein